MSNTAQSHWNPCAVRRVNILPAMGTEPAYVTVHFQDAEAAKAGYAYLLDGLADDPRTKLELDKPMPTLCYPVI
jgi:hypothetical protein